MSTKNGNARRVSMKTSDAYEGGSSLDGAAFEILEAETVHRESEEYGVQASLRLLWKIEGQDEAWERHYNAGKAERYDVDGDFIIPLKAAKAGQSDGLNKGCLLFKFLEALEAASPELAEAFDETGASALQGVTGTLATVPYKTAGGADAKYPLICIGSVDEAEPPAAKGKGKTTAPVSVPDKTEAAILALIEANTSVKKVDLPQLLLDEHKRDKDIKAMTQQALKTAWLFDADRPWTSDAKRGRLTA